MIPRMLPRPAHGPRTRRASRILLALAAMAALLSVDLPDAAAVPPLGTRILTLHYAVIATQAPGD